VTIYVRNGVGILDTIKDALNLVTVAVPPALPLALSIGTSVALARLKNFGEAAVWRLYTKCCVVLIYTSRQLYVYNQMRVVHSVAVPPALPLALSIGTSVALARLKNFGAAAVLILVYQVTSVVF
jgi:magnesium-transporting ATPase (P-type)